jgi:hypothetical protein
VPDIIKATGLRIIKPESVWRPHGKLIPTPQFGIGVFELLDDIFREFFKYKSKYPVKILIPNIPLKFPLFWASLFGEIDAVLMPRLERGYIEATDARVFNFQQENLGETMARDAMFPRRITQWGINPYPHASFRKDSGRVFFMDATKQSDVIDFWNLRAVGGDVIPLPKQLAEDDQMRKILVNFLKGHRRHWGHNPAVCDTASFIRARSRTMEEMQEYARTLKIDRDPNDPSQDGFFGLQHWYPRIWDEWGRDKDGALPDDPYGSEESSADIADTNKRTIRLKTLLPKFASEHGYRGEPRCTNEIRFSLYGSEEYLAEVFPKSSSEKLKRAISGLTSLGGDWRVGRNGIVKLVKGEFGEHRDIPAAEEIMLSWLRDRGWEPTLSAPGILAKQIYRHLEGGIGILRNEKLLGLLEHMNGGRVKQDGTPAEDNEVGQERDLSVGEVKNRLAATGARGDLHAYLLDKGVFRLGLRVQCPHCLRRSWWTLQDIQDLITCRRCLNSFPAVGNVEGATWSYKAAGPFSVPNYADGAYGVLLTLGQFQEHRMTTMRTTPIASFVAQGKKQNLEADFALFWQESLYGETRDGTLFGECKTYGQFEAKDFIRMRRIAKAFPGAVLVFSTLRKALRAKEVDGIARVAKAGRKYWKPDHPLNPVLVLTGTELLHWTGPPYCWEAPVRDKFQHTSGLLGLCDATQQIYLKLPPWQAEWHKKWEEKRLRRAEKIASQAKQGEIGQDKVGT